MKDKDIRWLQRFENYNKALQTLTDAINLARSRELTDLEKQGVIQAFEFTHELAWKMMKDFFEYQGDSNIYGSKDAIRLAFERGLIDDGQTWLEMITSRNLTSHTYNFEISEQIFSDIINKYFDLFIKLKDKFTQISAEFKG